jgi:cytochrome c
MRSLLLLAFGLMLVASAANAGDLVAGKKVFNKCRACHDIGEGAKNKVGPILNGVVGRPWGAVEGYKYSAGKEGTLLFIHEADPQAWNPETLRAYLHNPKDVIPKGKMAFPGVKDDADLENVIYYLAQFDVSGSEVDPDATLAEFPEGN